MGGHIRVFGHARGASLFVEYGMIASDSVLMSRYYTHTILHYRYSLLPAITVDGIIYSHIKVGGYNGEEFLEYLDGLAAQMNPYPGPRSVLVIDNCRIHHVFGVEELCEARYVHISLSHHYWTHLPDYLFSGIKLIYLPPYSPDYNPIEESFSFIKAYIRRHGHHFRNIVEMGDKLDPILFLYEALDKVTPEAAKGWFHNSGYI